MAPEPTRRACAAACSWGRPRTRASIRVRSGCNRGPPGPSLLLCASKAGWPCSHCMLRLKLQLLSSPPLPPRCALSVRFKESCLGDPSSWSTGQLPSALDAVISTFKPPGVVLLDTWCAVGGARVSTRGCRAGAAAPVRTALSAAAVARQWPAAGARSPALSPPCSSALMMVVPIHSWPSLFDARTCTRPAPPRRWSEVRLQTGNTTAIRQEITGRMDKLVATGAVVIAGARSRCGRGGWGLCALQMFFCLNCRALPTGSNVASCDGGCEPSKLECGLHGHSGVPGTARRGGLREWRVLLTHLPGCPPCSRLRRRHCRPPWSDQRGTH